MKTLFKAIYISAICRKNDIRHIHAHFANTPATTARYVALLTGISYSFTAHARDIYTVNPNLAENIRRALFVITCTENNLSYLKMRTHKNCHPKIHRNSHGVDLKLWTLNVPKTDTSPIIRLFTTGRIVEKKGHLFFPAVLRSLISKGYEVEWNVIGYGPFKQKLMTVIQLKGLENQVIFHGWKTPEEIQYLYARGGILIVPSLIASDGDRDGIPNVIPEAMAFGIPVIASAISGITELLDAGIVPVSEKDIESFLNAIIKLHTDRTFAKQQIKKAREWVNEHFDAEKQTDQLYRIFMNYLK